MGAQSHMERLRAHRRRRKSAAGMHQKPNGGDTTNYYAATVKIPPDVLEARDRLVAAEPRDLTGRLQGDPPRGYSELDRRGGGA